MVQKLLDLKKEKLVLPPYLGGRFSSTNLPGKDKINPWFLTGFSDAESTFSISILKNNELKAGWEIAPRFSIKLHSKDKSILEGIYNFFKVGYIETKGNYACYDVRSSEGLDVILNHFDKYPLIGKKRADYLMFKEILKLKRCKAHNTVAGLQSVVNLRASLNNGLSDNLKAAFPNTIPIVRPLVENQKIPNPNWLSGFMTGEGCFYIRISKSSSNKSGYQVALAASITQHNRDEQLMKNIVDYLGCGVYVPRLNKNWGEIRVFKFSELESKLIPFFHKYPISGVKALDFADFCKVALMMKNNDHITTEGLEKIKLIKSGMNTKR